MVDIKVSQGRDEYRMTLDLETEDGVVAIWWNKNGGPVQTGADGLPEGMLADAMLLALYEQGRELEAERAELWTESDEEDFRRGQYWDQRIDEARGK